MRLDWPYVILDKHKIKQNDIGLDGKKINA